MENNVLSNIYAFLVQKCAVNGLNIEKMRRAAGISHQVMYCWKKSDPYTIKQLKKLVDTIDQHAADSREQYAIENKLFAGNLIRTYSGVYVNVFDPKPDMFVIDDIAHGLSHKARFGGHTQRFMSVAEHSCNVAWLCAHEDKKAALLHDASEAYISDIPSPIKALLPGYKELENKVMACIAEKFGFEWPLSPGVKMADATELNREWDYLVLGHGSALSTNAAKSVFLCNYHRIFS